MGWIEFESFGFICPYFADIFIGCEALESLQTPCVIVGIYEVREMAAKLVVVVVVVAFDGGLFDGAVHALDLTVRPGVRDLCQAMVDPVFIAYTIKDVPTGRFVHFTVGELDAVIGEDGVDIVGQRLDNVAKELRCNHFPGFLVQFHVGELRSAVDCDEQT